MRNNTVSRATCASLPFTASICWLVNHAEKVIFVLMISPTVIIKFLDIILLGSRLALIYSLLLHQRRCIYSWTVSTIPKNMNWIDACYRKILSFKFIDHLLFLYSLLSYHLCLLLSDWRSDNPLTGINSKKFFIFNQLEPVSWI